MGSRFDYHRGNLDRLRTPFGGHERTLELIATGAPLEEILASLARPTESQTGTGADSYRDLVENLTDIVFSLDVDRHVAYISPPVEHQFGYRTLEMIGRPFVEFVHPEDRQFVQSEFAGVLAGNTRPCEFRMPDRSGFVHWCRSSCRPQFMQGCLVGITGVIVDITEQRRTQEALRKAEQNYRTLFEEAIVGIFQTSLEGRYITVNPALARMLGYESPEEVKASITDIARQQYVDPQRRREFQTLIETQGSVQGFECQLYRKNGSKMWASANARAIYQDGRVVGFEGTTDDITERKLLQQQLLQAQRLEAIGQLAGGIAHDFNNLLGVVLGHGELMLERLPFSDPSRRRVEQICHAARRAVSLTGQLLAFSRQQILHPIVLDLNIVVRNLNDIMARLLGDNIAILNRLDDSLGRLRGDVSQIEQVLLNLAVNARDAMPQGGTLTIATSNVVVDHTAERYSGAASGRYVLLTITDTGMGMDEETMKRIFEPFFTTKEKGQGTGLGLATVYGIVKQSGGYISVSSELGSGTIFSVYLPRTDEPVELIAPSGNSPVLAESAGGTILLVEDSGSLRSVLAEFLDEAGYRVLEAGSAEMALRLVEACPSPICLMITDVVMLGMNGHELAEQLMTTRPDMKVLYISGYTDAAVFRCGVLPGSGNFLNKPFTRDRLLSKIRDLLNAASPASPSHRVTN